ncbi:MAG: DNA-directed RNA polymerase subunit P [Thermoprotei archaeon]|nr:MAG: DNA-directed RNA polymerase subunit P [Thermoprotei archaeon]RLE90285.1 MAG: DNA-directed RNA polymerase subunit P [Thermoprotei archaeon]
MGLEVKHYICMRCKRRFSWNEMLYLPGIRCPYCGQRIIAKTRPLVAKRVKAI